MATKKKDKNSPNPFDDSPTDQVRQLSAEDMERMAAETLLNGSADSPPDYPQETPGVPEAPGVAGRVQSLQRVESEIHQLLAHWADIEKDLHAKAAEIEKLTALLAIRQGDVERLDHAVAAGLGERDEARAEVRRLQAELTRQKGASAEAEERIKVLLDEIQGLRAASARLDQDVAAREAARVQVLGELDRYRDALLGMEQTLAKNDKAVARRETEKAALAATIAGLEERLATLNGRREESEAAHARLQALLAQANREIERLSTELRYEQGARERLAAELLARDQQLAELRGELSSANAAIAAQRDEMKAREATAGVARALEQRLAASDQERDSARRELAAFNARLKAAESEVQAREQRIAELEAFSLGHVEALAAAKTELLAAIRARDASHSLISQRDREIAGLLASTETLKAGREDLTKNLAAQREVIEDLEAQLNANHATIAVLDADARRLAEIESHMQKLDARMAEQLGVKPGSDARASGDGNDTGNSRKTRIARLLVALQGDHPIKFPLYKQTMVIGRGKDTDIQVNGQFASRRHARICADGDEIFVEDLGSMNGILVNSKAVKRQRLHDGDVLDVGGSQLRFVDPSEHPSPGGTPDPRNLL
jgi:chromosome segregation ATPase